MNTPSTKLLRRQQSIHNLVEYAKAQPHSTEHFVELSSFPLASFSVLNDKNGMGHFFFYEESDTGSIIPYPEDKFNSIGWQWFNAFFKKHNIEHTMSEIKWKKRMDKTVDTFNAAIERDHGVIFSRDGSDDLEFLDEKKILLHVADAIVLWVHEVKKGQGIPPTFSIATEASSYVTPSMFFNYFIASLPKKTKKFIFYNADFLYVCFAYWGNHSMLPCRMDVPEQYMPHAYLLFNDTNFNKHMKGKLNQLRREKRNLDNIDYLLL
jgi:hypothetical protein